MLFAKPSSSFYSHSQSPSTATQTTGHYQMHYSHRRHSPNARTQSCYSTAAQQRAPATDCTFTQTHTHTTTTMRDDSCNSGVNVLCGGARHRRRALAKDQHKFPGATDARHDYADGTRTGLRGLALARQSDVRMRW